MRALDYSDVAPTKWDFLTWMLAGLFLVYAIARNCPGESLEASRMEVRNFTTSFVHEVRSYPHPIGWPIVCIRPANGHSWDSDFQVAKMGPPRQVAKTEFFLSVFLLDIAIIVMNTMAIVYLIQTKLFKFSIRSMLIVTTVAAGLLVAKSPQNLQSLWNGVDTLIIAICFAPLTIAGPVAYYLHFTYDPYVAPEPGMLSHAQVPTADKRTTTEP